jgi:DNA-binding beta-propeller fold protein YncE
MNGLAGRGRRILIALIGAAVLGLAGAPGALGADRVYWGNGDDTISYANLDGSGGGHELNLSGATPNRMRGLAIDSATGRIYWGNSGNDTISYANLDGTGGGNELNISGANPNYIHGLTIDPAARRVYWANDNGNSISYADLEGSGGHPLDISGATPDQPYGVALDLAGGRIFWANVSVDTSTISYAKLDGSGGGDQLDISGATANKPHGVAIDPTAGRIYWGNINSTIFYASLDGTGGHELSLSGSHPSGPVGVAIDPTAGRIYWANLGKPTISYAKLDGTGGGGELDLSGANPNALRFLVLLRKPAGAGAPRVTGGSSVGSVLACSQGSWAPDLPGAFLYRAPHELSYRWTRNGADIPGATDGTYTAYAAGRYRCRVTATNAAGATSQTSDQHAVSSPPASHTLAVSVFGSGNGTVTGPGISCPRDCVGTYADGTSVLLRARPTSRSSFAGWGEACSGRRVCRVKMTADRTVTARFARLPNTEITEAKIDPANQRASFEFKALGGSKGFQCALAKRTKDETPRPRFSNCRSPESYTALAPGRYTFFVRAFNAGGRDPTPARKSFTSHAPTASEGVMAAAR